MVAIALGNLSSSQCLWEDVRRIVRHHCSGKAAKAQGQNAGQNGRSLEPPSSREAVVRASATDLSPSSSTNGSGERER